MRFSGKVALLSPTLRQKAGAGREAACRAHASLESALGAGGHAILMLTEAPGHAADIASSLDPSCPGPLSCSAAMGSRSRSCQRLGAPQLGRSSRDGRGAGGGGAPRLRRDVGND